MPKVGESVVYFCRPGSARMGQMHVAAIVVRVFAESADLVTFPPGSEVKWETRVPAFQEGMQGHYWCSSYGEVNPAMSALTPQLDQVAAGLAEGTIAIEGLKAAVASLKEEVAGLRASRETHTKKIEEFAGLQAEVRTVRDLVEDVVTAPKGGKAAKG